MTKTISFIVSFLFAITVFGQSDAQRKSEWTKWNIDTLRADNGKYLVIKIRSKQIKKSSCSNYEEIRHYFDACKNLTEEYYTLSKVCIKSRPIKTKSKTFKSNCITNNGNFNSITCDSINITIKDTLLNIINHKKGLTQIEIKSEYGEFLWSEPLTIENYININSFPWTGIYVLEFKQNDKIIKRDKVYKSKDKLVY